MAERLTCKYGHPWTTENTKKNSDGIVVCKTCTKNYTTAYHVRRKAKGKRFHQTTCAKGHDFTPDNTRRIRRINPDKSETFLQVCLKCERVRNALRAARRALKPPKKPRGGRPLSITCRRGHPLRGENLIVSFDKKRNMSVRKCRTCRNAYAKENEFLKRRGLKKAPIRLKFNSLEERIQAHIVIDGECHRWTGTTSNGNPVVSHNGEHHVVRRWMCDQAGRQIPPGHLCSTPPSCVVSCVRLDHIQIITHKDIYQRYHKDRSKANTTMKRLYRSGRAEYIEKVLVHVPTMRRVLTRMRSRQDSDDIIQDVILNVYAHWLDDHGAGPDQMRAFLVRAVQNRRIDLRRSRWRRNFVSMTCSNEDRHDMLADDEARTEMDFPAPLETDPYYQLQRDEVERLRRRIYNDRMREIPPRARTALLMKVDGMSQKEIADKLGIAENTVETHLKRAYNVLYGPPNQKWDKRERRDSYYLEAAMA